MFKFLLIDELKWIDPFDSKKCTRSGSKVCVLEVILEYTKELHELHNDYLLASDKVEIIKQMLSRCQLKIVDFYSIPICSVTNLVLNLFDKELHYENVQLYLRLGSKLKNTSCIRIQSMTLVKTIYRI